MDAVDYEIDVQVMVYRKTTRYESDMLAKVHAVEVLTCAPTDLRNAFTVIVDEATRKARNAFVVKMAFESAQDDHEATEELIPRD